MISTREQGFSNGFKLVTIVSTNKSYNTAQLQSLTVAELVTELLKIVKRLKNKPMSKFSWVQGSVDLYYISNRTQGIVKTVTDKLSNLFGFIGSLV